MQTLLGGVTAHYHAETGGFVGIDLARVLPYNLTRTWHLQLALFIVVAAYAAAGVFLAPIIAGSEPRRQEVLVYALLAALAIVVFGSMAGEAASYKGWITGTARPLVGALGWEYLDLGQLWQLLLIIGLVLWVIILRRGLKSKLSFERRGNLPYLFFYSALSIPLFYAVGLASQPRTDFAVADFWRFWVVHLWVEDFLELFTTILVAYIFVLLGVVGERTATRVVYLDILLYSIGGVVGSMHHMYFSGTPAIHMALRAFFSAPEVIPLTFLTVERGRSCRWARASSLARLRHGFRTDGRSCSSPLHRMAAAAWRRHLHRRGAAARLARGEGCRPAAIRTGADRSLGRVDRRTTVHRSSVGTDAGRSPLTRSRLPGECDASRNRFADASHADRGLDHARVHRRCPRRRPSCRADRADALRPGAAARPSGFPVCRGYRSLSLS